MTDSGPAPGWYPDPANDQQLRWWTGERWTGAARPLEFDAGIGAPAGSPATPDLTRQATAVSAPAAAAADEGTAAQPLATTAADTGWGEAGVQDGGGLIAGWPRERMIAAVAIGGLLLTSIAIWLFAVVLTGANEPATVAGGDTGGEEDLVGEDDAAPEDGSVAQGEAIETERDGEGGEDASGERTVNFDDGCSVEVDPAEVEGTPLRPWQFEECDSAPVNLDGGEGRWIVVVASIDGDLDASQAREQADRHGSDLGLLWSSHYPSLNPGWWVVFDGPFTEEDDATEVAEDIGSGSYPRMLSDDEGDRYCIAEDGC